MDNPLLSMKIWCQETAALYIKKTHILPGDIFFDVLFLAQAHVFIDGTLCKIFCLFPNCSIDRGYQHALHGSCVSSRPVGVVLPWSQMIANAPWQRFDKFGLCVGLHQTSYSSEISVGVFLACQSMGPTGVWRSLQLLQATQPKRLCKFQSNPMLQFLLSS